MEIIVWILAGLVMVMVAGGFTMCRRWKKTAEAALTGRTVKIGAARDFSEALIANTPDGFVVVDEQMTIVQVNEAFCRITGRSPEELVGRRPPYPGWAPEEEGAIREHFGNVVHGEYAPIELTHIRKDGTRVPLLMNPGSLETANGDKFFFAVAKDLTEIKKTEDELRESEAKFRRIAETSTDAIYLLDLEGTITYISPVVKDILGYTQEEFVGRNFGVHFAGDDLVHAQEAFEKNLGGEDVRNIELRILNKKKEPVFLEMNATPIRKDDRIVGVQGMARDITERKLAEVALRDSDVKFKAQYKGLPIPVYTWQKQGDDFVLIDFNNAAEEITEGKIKDLVGMKAGQFFADDPDIPDELWRAFEEERFFQRELPYRFRSTGATKTLRVSYGYAPPDLVIVHTEDVTARAEAEERLRESEARFRAAVESIPFDLFVVGEDGRYTMQNSVCKEHWGDLIGKRPEDVDADAETLATWLSNNERALSGEIVEGDVSFKVGGEEKVFHNVISPIYDGDHMRGVLGVNIEITKRVCAEEALRKSEERLSGIISSTPNVAVEGYDAAGRILIWNPAAEKIFGWSAEEAVGKTLDQLILSEEDAAGFVKILEEVGATGRPSGPTEWNVTAKNGEERTVSSTIFAIPAPGNKKEYVCMDIDITARRLAEKALRESEEKYRFLIENVGTSVSFWDPNGKLLLINQAGARGLGSTPEALIGKSLHEFADGDHADELLARHRRVLELDTGAQFEDQIEIKQGKRWYRSILQPVRHADGEPIGVQVVSHDITDLLQAERELKDRDARLRLMVKQIPAVIWTTDTNLRFTSSTGAGLSVLGHEVDEVVGESLYEYFQTDDPEFLPIAKHRKSLQGEPTIYEMEWGQSIWQTQTEPLRDETGEIVGCLAIGLDVTERKRAEEEIQRSRAQLRLLTKRLHEVREEESAAISREIHDELGQVLTGLKMSLSWVERRCTRSCEAGEGKNVIARIKKMYGEIDSTIGTVRKISAQLRPRILDDMGLLGAIEWAMQEFEELSGVKCTIIQVGLGDDSANLDSARSTAIFRIFQEILTNVSRHAEATRVDIELRSSRDMFMLEVRDNGKGMPPEELRRPRGIGLIGMRERAQAFGGKIDIDSSGGMGTSVRLLIPIADARDD